MMHNPAPPSDILKNEIEHLKLTVTETAKRLGMSRAALSRVLNGKASISTDLAIRLETAGLSTAKTWLMMQLNYDLANAQKIKQPEVKPLSA